jgi:hypothetical protein
LLSLALVVVTVWGLVARWDEKLAHSKKMADEFGKLDSDLSVLRDDAVSEDELHEFVVRAWKGRTADGFEGVSAREDRRGWYEAVQRFP